MMKKLLLISLFATLWIIGSCKSEVSTDQDVSAGEKHEALGENIETLFTENVTFTDTMMNLLLEINICDPQQMDKKNLQVPACDPSLFRFFSFDRNASLQDAFLLLAKSGTHGYAIRRLFVFQREQGRLVQVNRFMANLIGKRPTDSGKDDLILRFSDGEGNFFNCVYAWTDRKYQFKKVEQINDANVKPEFQDSMNVEISKFIIDHVLEI